jgi:ubiquinone/menaquinone biosynthesis C-methylase UbiE/DNA-binding transcriptional ArsR family regulator
MMESPLQSTLNSYWDGRAAAYDAQQQRDERLRVDHAAWSRVFAAALPEDAVDVLDVGTGSGFLAFLLADQGRRVMGTDLSEGMLAIARDRAAQRAAEGLPAPEFHVGDAVDPDLPPGSLDAVVNRYVMWTLREPATALAHWMRLLRPGGVLAVVDAPWFPYGMQANTTEGFAQHYSAEVGRHLPLAEASTIDDTVAAVRQAGYLRVTATPLTEILEIDTARGAAPGHHVQLQHLITGVRPPLAEGTQHRDIADAAVESLRPDLAHWERAFALCADPTRLKLLVAMHAAPEASVSDLAHAVGISANAVTQALRKLEDAGIAAPRRDGRHRRWRLVDTTVHDLLHHVAAPHSPLHPEHG